MFSPIVSVPRPRAPRGTLLLSVAAALSLLSALAVMSPGQARAAAPASVTVRVEGLNETKLPPTLVTTTTTPVVKDGNAEHACPGTSALGALQDATGGAWEGPWNSEFKQYEIFSIEGENHPFESGSKANYFWELWRNYKSSEVGACGAEAENGEQILYVVGCFGESCPTALEFANIEVLATEVAPSANAGETVNVTVKRYKTNGEASPAVGASVSEGGTTVTTDAQGHATLTAHATGSQLVSATDPGTVRTEAKLCVHNGNDGTCGTTAPGAPVAGTGSAATTAAPYSGPFALVADVTGLIDGHRYALRHSPRVLTGSVTAHDTIKNVALRLTRTVRTKSAARRCSYYDGTTERFHTMRCGAAHGRFFSVGTAAKFSYLLPFSLPRGRYVLDVAATDAAGNRAPLARGSSRVVFEVG
jgi:hypothetical protein